MISLFVLLIEFLFLNMLPTEGRPYWMILIMIGVFSVAFIFDISYSRHLREVLSPVLTAYLIRLFVIFFDLYFREIYSLPNSGADTEWFYTKGVAYATSPDSTVTNELLIKITGYGVRYLGNSRLYLQFLLMLCSLVSIIFADKMMVAIDLSYRNRKTALYILALLPNYAILSSIFLREPIVTMFITISLYFFIKWWTGKSEINFWISVIFVFAASSFHSGAIGVVIGYILSRLLYNRKSRSIKISFRTVIPAIALLVVFVYLYNNYGEMLFGKMLNIESIENISRESTTGGSSYAAYAGNSNSLINMILFTPIRMVMFQFSPFIWQMRGLSDIIALCFDSLYFMYVTYKTVKYIRLGYVKNKSLVILLFIVALATTFVFGWGVTNTGTALRHRNKMAVLYAVLLGLTIYPEIEEKPDEEGARLQRWRTHFKKK